MPQPFMRRSARNHDSYQSEEKILDLMDRMKILIFPQGSDWASFKKLLYAVQHVERYSAKDVKSGRRPKFERNFLLNASAKLKGFLDAETNGRISLLRFVSTYLPVLDYPGDVKTALADNRINLEEARILNRIAPKNLGSGVRRKPSQIRKEMLESHLKRMGTQSELRGRVAEIINGSPKGEAAKVAQDIARMDVAVDELLELDEFDTEHLFWEEIKSLVYLAREVDSGLLDDDSLTEILKDLDSIKLRLVKFRKKPESEDS